MATRKQLLDQNDNEILPITDTESVRNPQNIGGTLEGRLATVENTANSAIRPLQVGEYTENNFVSFDANGGIKDSLKKESDFATSEQGTKADNAIPMPSGGGDGQILEKDSNEAGGVKWVEKPQNGKDAYHVWLDENGYTEQDHPINTYFDFLKAHISQYVNVSYDATAYSDLIPTGGSVPKIGNAVTSNSGAISGKSPDQTTLDEIVLMPNTDGTTDPTAMMMFVTNEIDNTPDANTYQFVYAGDLGSGDIRFHSGQYVNLVNIVNDPSVGGVDNVASAEIVKNLHNSVASMTEEVRTYNLFDKSNLTNAYINIDTGSIVSSPNSNNQISALIEVKEGYYYYISGRNPAVYYMVLLSEDLVTLYKPLIASSGNASTNYSTQNTSGNSNANTQFKVPSGAKYVRFAVRFKGYGNPDSIMLNEIGSEYNSSYTPPAYKPYTEQRLKDERFGELAEGIETLNNEVSDIQDNVDVTNQEIRELETEVVGNGKFEISPFTAVPDNYAIFGNTDIRTYTSPAKPSFLTISPQQDGSLSVSISNSGSDDYKYLMVTDNIIANDSIYEVEFTVPSTNFGVMLSFYHDEKYYSYCVRRGTSNIYFTVYCNLNSFEEGLGNVAAPSDWNDGKIVFSIKGTNLKVQIGSVGFDFSNYTYAPGGVLFNTIHILGCNLMAGFKNKNKSYNVFVKKNDYYNQNSLINQVNTRIDALTTLAAKITTNDAYKGIAPQGIRSKLISRSDDITIALLGDSITALTNIGNEFPNAANLPAGCQHNAITYMLWNLINTNKQVCDRFDSQANIFTETSDAFETTNTSAWIDLQNNIGGNGGNDYGEYSPDNCLYRASKTANASVQFDIDIYDFEKLAFIYRAGWNASDSVTVSCTSGKLLVLNSSNEWVEANGFNFSQLLSGTGTYNARWVRNIPLFFKRVSKPSENEVVTVTITNTATNITETTGWFYYWGTERWNFTTIRVENLARAGRNTGLLNRQINTELALKPHIDCVLFQVPIWNELKSTYWTAYSEDHNDMINNIVVSRGKDCIILFQHTQKACWDGNKNLQFQANGVATNPKTNKTEWECIMYYLSLMQTYISNQSIEDSVALAVPYSNLINFCICNGYTVEEVLTPTTGTVNIGDGTSGVTVDNTSFTTDGAHCSSVGFKFYASLIAPMFYKQ